MAQVTIRPETPADHRRVEEVIRAAFWNLHVPGCDEHWLAHCLRGHPDFVPELDLVLEVDGLVIATVMYTHTTLMNQEGTRLPILTFGPVAVEPPWQRQGYGKLLLEHSMELAMRMGHRALVIFGNPGNYVGLGFVSSSRYRVGTGGGVYPTAMLARELLSGALDSPSPWTYLDSTVFHLDSTRAEEFDRTFPALPREWRPSQEEFRILSSSRILLPPGI